MSKRRGNEVANNDNIEISAGIHYDKMQRKKAKKALPRGMQVEKDRKEQGWIWITDGKITKQTHPENLKKNLDSGWRKLNV